jgi:hypothetical protein
MQIPRTVTLPFIPVPIVQQRIRHSSSSPLNFNHLILLLHGCVALELDNMRW